MATSIGPSQLKRLVSELRSGKRSVLLREYRKAIRDAGKPVVTEVRGAVLALTITGQQGSRGVLAPTRGGGRKARVTAATARARTDLGRRKATAGAGLRETVANAVRLRNLARGVTIEALGQRMPAGQESLPKDLESHKGWDHPTFGDWSKKAHERGGPWFYPTIRRNQPRFAASIESAHGNARRALDERVGSV